MDARTFLEKHVALFAGVCDERLTDMASASTLETFKKGQTIVFQGETVEALRVVAVGKATVFAKVPGQGAAPVAELGSGDTFGEASILESGTAGATVKAAEDGTVVLVIPQEAFRRLLAESPDFVARARALIASRRAPPPKPQA